MQERRVAPPLNLEAHHGSGARRLLVTLSVAAVVVAADQLTKSWAVGRLSHGSIHVVWKLDLILTYNTGSAFSLAQGWGTVIAGIAVILVVGLLIAASRSRSDAMALSLGLIVGGALGNLTDRFVRGRHAVVDFVALHFWPTFNVADASIVVGAIVAGLLLWRSAPPDDASGTTGADRSADGRGATP